MNYYEHVLENNQVNKQSLKFKQSVKIHKVTNYCNHASIKFEILTQYGS